MYLSVKSRHHNEKYCTSEFIHNLSHFSLHDFVTTLCIKLFTKFYKLPSSYILYKTTLVSLSDKEVLTFDLILWTAFRTSSLVCLLSFQPPDFLVRHLSIIWATPSSLAPPFHLWPCFIGDNSEINFLIGQLSSWLLPLGGSSQRSATNCPHWDSHRSC